MAPITSTRQPSGVTTSTFMIGSSSVIPALCGASRMGPRPVTQTPSLKNSDVVIFAVEEVHREVDTMGKPICDPASAVSRIPFLTEGDIFLRNVAALDLVEEHGGRASSSSTRSRAATFRRNISPSVEKGIRETAEAGSLIGFPYRRLRGALARRQISRRRLFQGLAFEITGRGAMREAAHKAGITLLEPIMKVEVVTPEDYLVDVIGAINSRRGQIQGTECRGNAQIVEAMIPLANMFGYMKDLEVLTEGKAAVSMFFERFDFLPPEDTDPD